MFTFRIYDSNLPFKSFDLMLHESTATFGVAKKEFSYIIGSTFETEENWVNGIQIIQIKWLEI